MIERPAPLTDPQTYTLIGIAMEVHRQLGHGFLEAVYRDAFQYELQARGIPYQVEVAFPILYKERVLPTTYRADFLCYDQVIVEMKALGKLGNVEGAQVLNYLRASRLSRGLLLNFGGASLEYGRLVWSRPSVIPAGQSP
jgi:GxxExxY protein